MTTTCIPAQGISQQSMVCDKGLAFWNGSAGVLMMLLALASAITIFFDTRTLNLASKLVDTNMKSSLYEFGNGALGSLALLCGVPLLIVIWSCLGYVDVISSPTCRRSAALLYGGTITNITLIISTLSFASIMATYFIASSKGFYDITILKCICDPVGIAIERVASILPPLPVIQRQDWPIIRAIPTLEQLKDKLPTYDVIKVYAKQVAERLFPRALPEGLTALLNTPA